MKSRHQALVEVALSIEVELLLRSPARDIASLQVDSRQI